MYASLEGVEYDCPELREATVNVAGIRIYLQGYKSPNQQVHPSLPSAAQLLLDLTS